MPRGDKTGPLGEGPMTGRRMGLCAGFNAPGFMNSGSGRGLGFRRGFGRGFRRVFIPFAQPQVITEKEEKQMLEENLKSLKQEMEEIQKRLKELK